MHNIDLDLSISEITKIEGAATVDIKVRNNQVTQCQFAISEYKRFYTQALENKSVMASPQLVARVCGTCSNAHLLCNIKTIETALNVTPSPQTMLLRRLLYYGLIIRDHGLHLYVFVLPDLFLRDSILEFDEKNHQEHELLDDCFEVKAIGNDLGKVVGGRSVHAPFPAINGFLKLPQKSELENLHSRLENSRIKILRLIKLFHECPWELKQKVEFVAMIDKKYSFLDGVISSTLGDRISQSDYFMALEQKTIPYSHATGYEFKGILHMVGALARMNLNSNSLHARTREDVKSYLGTFPSQNIFHNNLAQSIEMLHAVDSSIDLIRAYQETAEPIEKLVYKESSGTAVIEAPRGTLLHRLDIDAKGSIKHAQIVVPTGQNQIGIEQSIKTYVNLNTEKSKEALTHEIENIIRAYDPCMSCASHFLKIRWI